MSKFTLFLFLFSFINEIRLDVQKKDDWKLVWSDEFEYQGLPDPTKWNYEIGHIRNKEKQYYTGPRLENLEVKKGKLYITGKKESYPNAAYQEGSENWKESQPFADYTSGCIITEGINAWLYGRIEVRAKLPRGNGTWPAIWMLGENFKDRGWPYSGEIDIMEHVGIDAHNIHGTVHYQIGDNHEFASDGAKFFKKRLFRKFHTYAIEWTEEKIDFFVDDILYHSFEIDKAGKGPENPFRKPQFLLINLAMGASWPGPINDKILPQQFVIDFVRVYQ